MSAAVPASALLVLPVLPLLVAALQLVPSWRRTTVWLGPWAAVPAAAAALAGWVGTPAGAPPLLLGAATAAGSLTQVFLFFTGLIWWLGGVYAVGYLDRQEAPRFFLFYLLAMSGNIGLVVAGDVVTFCTFYALMSFASYGLVVHAGTAEVRAAGKVYIVLVVLGELLVFPALLLGVQASGSLLTADVAAGIAASPHRDVAVALLALGFGIKAGALPLHVWLPLAYPAAPTPASAVLSGSMGKAGLLGLLRLLPLGLVALPGWGQVFMGAGLTAAVLALVVGIMQTDPKALLAYSSIGKMGVMLAAVGAALARPDLQPAALTAVIMLAAHHALTKSTLFLSVGIAGETGRRGWAGRLARAGVVLPALSFAGLPFTSGAVSKVPLKMLGAEAGGWSGVFAAVLPLAAVGTGLLMVRFLRQIWPRTQGPEDRPPTGHGHGVGASAWVAWGVSVAGVVLVPVYYGLTGYDGFCGKALGAGYLVAALWPALAAALLATLALRSGRALPQLIPAGDLLHVYVSLLRGADRLLPARAKTYFARQATSAMSVTQLSATGGLAEGAPLHSLVRLLRAGERWLERWSMAGVAITGLFILIVALAARL